jgi:hypothetical protein
LKKKLSEVKQKDLTTLYKLGTDNKIICKNWPVIPNEYRNYETIEEYIP